MAFPSGPITGKKNRLKSVYEVFLFGVLLSLSHTVCHCYFVGLCWVPQDHQRKFTEPVLCWTRSAHSTAHRTLQTEGSSYWKGGRSTASNPTVLRHWCELKKVKWICPNSIHMEQLAPRFVSIYYHHHDYILLLYKGQSFTFNSFSFSYPVTCSYLAE
jgi:hypothetical protein